MLPSVASAAALLLVAVAASAADERVNFARDIQPILAAKCFACHGPDADARQAGLRLDTASGATAKLESGLCAIVTGKPDQSELLKRVTSRDADTRMPPAETGKSITPQEAELLKRWIAAGAEYEAHWSFVPPVRPAPPALKEPSDWPRQPLDHFVLARLQQEGLQPSPAADRYVLVRRVYLDLTGLPPTPAEADAFVADERPDAYERLVDRLLASPALGERWAQVWLDLARYADSAGYAFDPPRTIWRYRDWVVQAINQNQPYDQFTIEQLAGDLLARPSEAQLLATAFHRNTTSNHEGGTDNEEFRNIAVVDRVNTTMSIWMGLTAACAQCHTHKYDPITQAEYFGLFAIFNQTEDADLDDDAPNLTVMLPEDYARRKKLQSEAKAIAAKLTATSSVKLHARRGPLLTRYVRIELPGNDAYLNMAEVQVFSRGKNIATAGTAKQSTTGYDRPAALAIDGNTNGDFAAESVSTTGNGDDPWWEVDLGSPQPIEAIVLWNRTDAGTERLKNFRVIALDDNRVANWAAQVADVPRPTARWKLPAKHELLTPTERVDLARYLTLTAKLRLAAIEKELAEFAGTPTPIMRELPKDKQRRTRIQYRGNFLDLGPDVSPGVPAALQLSQDRPANRLQLARWLVDRRNPLTARVAVNRYWEQLFGIGIVETSEDFGSQGELPSHPELLDYLAVEFMESGWDVKRLLRLIVTSATYRQSSNLSPELYRRDPQNRLLARGPRFRLSAEAVRDQSLSAAGLLSNKMGGPSVQPPRPKLHLTTAFGGVTDWETSSGEDKFRRGLYTSWRRTTPYPSMTTFDATSREVCTLRRTPTNTPLQALVTMNDPAFVEAAQGLARRIVTEGGANIHDRARYGFRLCVTRPPSSSEVEQLVQLYDVALAKYRDDGAAAKKMNSESCEAASEAELAAWTVVSNVLLNLDEALTRR
jgi:hypothetical protein